MMHTPAVQFHKGGRKRAERGERGMGRTEERREWRERVMGGMEKRLLMSLEGCS